VLLGVVIALARLKPAPIWWALVIVAATAVLSAELFNTALERLADHLHPERHPEIRLLKDCAAGAVLIASIGAMGVAMAFFISLLISS
jgi:diacylglycerol kinase (ATP)